MSVIVDGVESGRGPVPWAVVVLLPADAAEVGCSARRLLALLWPDQDLGRAVGASVLGCLTTASDAWSQAQLVPGGRARGRDGLHDEPLGRWARSGPG